MDEETGLLAFGLLVAAILFIAWRNLNPVDETGDGDAVDSFAGGDLGGVMETLGLTNPNADQDTFARTIWGEARGEGYQGQQAVGCVVRNRVLDGKWPRTYSGVCKQPKQFSCWNSNDPNLPKLKAVTTADLTFQQCLAIAQGLMDGSLTDITGGAVNYHSTAIARPASFAGLIVTVQIGHHIFYREA